MNPRKATILCIDDVEANLELLECILVPKGYAVVSAANGTDALVKIKSQTIDLVLLDILMPGMNGFEVCRRIKEDPEIKNIPIIMITALTAKHDRVRGIEAGAEEFLAKPFDQTEVLARIKMLLKVKELDDARVRAEELLQKSNEQLQATVEELTAASERVRTLTGLIPICANCKKIRDDAGYWQSVEKYMQDHTDATFTHGICPACIEKLFPELGARAGAHHKALSREQP